MQPVAKSLLVASIRTVTGPKVDIHTSVESVKGFDVPFSHLFDFDGVDPSKRNKMDIPQQEKGLDFALVKWYRPPVSAYYQDLRSLRKAQGKGCK